MGRRLDLVRDLGRMVWRRKLWIMVPFLSFLLFGMFLLVVVESPALLPFFYAIF
ncbi:MAG: hypothetical protein ISR64_00150 [Deltaproteobacteria bacterium]|nr:hypothetical protein [Deltaproteobacteria bacterium]